jgi:hypothetical protein
LGLSWRGGLSKVGLGMVGPVKARRSRRGGHGEAWCNLARRGAAVTVGLATARLDQARRSGQGRVWPGSDRCGQMWRSWHGKAGCGVIRIGVAG